MNWDDLKLFLDVVRHPRLEQAAAKSNIDATTISRRIKRLESALGTTLFERTRRGHVLTPAGDALAKRAEAMETLAIDIAADDAADTSATGRIRLGVPEGLGTTIIAPALTAFRAKHPHINVDLIALSGFVSVPKREADMSLLLTRPTAGRLKIRQLTKYSLGLYCAKDFLEPTDPITSLEHLRDYTLVGYVDDLIYSSQLRYFEDLLPGRTPDLCSTSINAQLRIIKAGAGIGILPTFMAEQHPDLIRLLPKAVTIERTFWLAVHEDVADLKRNRLMSEFLASNLRHLT